MILHPGILSLLIGSFISFGLIMYATLLGFRIILSWDFSSSSEKQLTLERKTYLISTLINMVLAFGIVSGLLFLFTVEDIHVLFIGAMCGTGTLNANPIGWWILITKILIFFAASLWVIVNNLDQSCEDAPLVKHKYRALPLLLLLLGADLVLQYLYFTGLEPEKITSCCGSLFGAGSGTVAAELAGMDPNLSMWVFYSTGLCYIITLWVCFRVHAKALRFLLLGEAIALVPISLVSVISFISIYIYQLPTHHCPFDMLQKNYHYIGYPLYIGLFGGLLFGMVPGLIQLLPETASLKREKEVRERRWLLLSLILFGIFNLISMGYLLASGVTFLS